MNTLYSHYFIFCLIALALLMFASCEPTEETGEDNTIYLSTVFEYVYGPGQHAAQAKPADTQYIIGNPAKHSGWLYLGGFGGYVVAGFSANIPNNEGPDFEVFALPGAGPEPAVVYVMRDDNGDGLPNETWYELKGSEFDNSKRNYSVTYYKPAVDTANITWIDSNRQTGELKAGFGNPYSSSWWWPETKENTITFHGTRLPDAYENTQVGDASNWTVPEGRFEWGYAENSSGEDYYDYKDYMRFSNRLDIGNAVDGSGEPIHIDHIRFIKIQSAVLQQAGWLNEISPEIRGAGGLK
ncbi:MAG: hypothetical protein PHZ12_03980 [Paludibacter sp.]|nr:hypothetical protein [Paludibacter sp.]MDD4428171.1 hypothetical protein [Paludibacter sp.]